MCLGSKELLYSGKLRMALNLSSSFSGRHELIMPKITKPLQQQQQQHERNAPGNVAAGSSSKGGNNGSSSSSPQITMGRSKGKYVQEKNRL